MRTYSPVPLGIGQLLNHIFSAAGPVGIRLWPLFVLLVAINTFFTAITGLYLTPNQTLSLKPGIVLVIFIAGALVFLFITAMIYHYVHVMLQGNLPSLIESFRRAKQRYLSLLLMTFLLLVISIILFFICYSLISFGTSLSDSLNNRGLDIIFKVLAIVIAAAVVFLLYFAFPIVVLYDNSAFKSIQLSVRLVWRDMRRVVFIVVFIFLLYMLINMLFVGLINSKDAIAINIIVFIITLLFMPITIAVMPLILLHDAELRYGAEVRNL